MEVRLLAFGSVRHEGELRYAENFALYIFDVFFPHVTGGVREHPQG
jgi:hypothetical protein